MARIGRSGLSGRSATLGGVVIAVAALGAACGPGPVGSGTNPASMTPPARSSPSLAPPSPTLGPGSTAAARTPPLTPVPGSAPPANVGPLVAQHVSAFRDAVLAATSGVPSRVPEARQPDEGIDAYGKRATAAAATAATPIRDLVLREREWLAGLDDASCPIVGRYTAILDAYWVVAQGIWTAHYAPDASLLRRALSNIEGLNAAIGKAVPKLLTAAAPCQTQFTAALGPPFSTVVGTQSADLPRDPSRLHESPLGNLVADAMRLSDKDAAAAFLNSGGVRADLLASPPTVGEQPGEITWGEMLLVLPFGNRVILVTATGDELRSALLNGFAPACDPGFSGGTGRFPQVSGLAVRFHCEGPKPVVDELWRAPEGPDGSRTPIGPADTIRLVTLDYVLDGGDGYAMFAAAANGAEPGDSLLDVATAYVTAHAPVGPAAEGRIVGP